MTRNLPATPVYKGHRGGRATSARASLFLALSVVLFFSSCAGRPEPFDERAYSEEIERWKASRLAELNGEQGWLTLVGLFWLKDGENKIGGDASNDIVLPKERAPAEVGSLRLADGAVRFEARPGVEVKSEGRPVSSVELRSDADGPPTVLTLGTLTLQLIKRGDRLGLRVKDTENPARLNFKGLEYFPVNKSWRVEARFEPFDPPKSIPIVNVLGMEEGQPSPGALVFEMDGRTHRLDALSEKGTDELFIIFADGTSGRETYGAGRYLYVHPPDAQRRVVVDFNKSHSPPCAYTDFATCPLPPAQNRLALRVEAGERFAGH